MFVSKDIAEYSFLQLGVFDYCFVTQCRKLKEVHKRLNELRELVQYYEQTSDMVVDTVNENVKEEDEETEDGSLFEAMFDSEQENHEPVTNIRYKVEILFIGVLK